MKAQKISSKTAALFLFTSMALAGCGGAPQSGSALSSNGGNQSASSGGSNGGEELFSDASAEAPNNPQDDATGEKSLRKRYVRVNFDLLKRAVQGAVKPGSTFNLNLFDDQKVEITLEDVQKISENNIVIVGRIKGDENSAVTLVMKDGVLVANVRRGESTENFEVRASSNGLHAIRVPAEDPKEDCQTVEAPQATPEDPLLGDKIVSADPNASPLATPVIDMLVAYTPRARSEQGGTNAIQALIQMGIADTNRAMTDSGVNLRVRLVGMYETRNSETGNLFTDLPALQGKTDGKWDELHAIRTRLGADQVTLVGSYSMNPNAAGIGNVNATYSSAFTIVRASYFRLYTMSHELGHNIGLNHTDGLESAAGRFRTIIAYGSYPRIRRYSNPNTPYNGFKTGDASHNEAAILNRNGAGKAGLTASVVKAAVAAGTKSDSVSMDQNSQTQTRD